MKKVLIVEDEVALRHLYEKAFAKNGNFEVATASDGQEGLDAIAKSRPDIVLLDIMMPIMDGMTMLNKLRGDEATKDLPVLMLTNSGDLKNITDAMVLHADEYIVKSKAIPEKIVQRVKDKLGIQ